MVSKEQNGHWTVDGQTPNGAGASVLDIRSEGAVKQNKTQRNQPVCPFHRRVQPDGKVVGVMEQPSGSNEGAVILVQVFRSLLIRGCQYAVGGPFQVVAVATSGWWCYAKHGLVAHT